MTPQNDSLCRCRVFMHKHNISLFIVQSIFLVLYDYYLIASKDYVTLYVKASYPNVSSVQSVLDSPAERSFTSESCRSFPLRSRCLRWDLSLLRTEVTSAQHSWRLHSFNLQVRTCFVLSVMLYEKEMFKMTWTLQDGTDLMFILVMSWLIENELKVHVELCHSFICQHFLLCPLNPRDLTLTSSVYNVGFSAQHTAGACLDPAGCFHAGPTQGGGKSQSWELNQCDRSISV